MDLIRALEIKQKLLCGFEVVTVHRKSNVPALSKLHMILRKNYKK